MEKKVNLQKWNREKKRYEYEQEKVAEILSTYEDPETRPLLEISEVEYAELLRILHECQKLSPNINDLPLEYRKMLMRREWFAKVMESFKKVPKNVTHFSKTVPSKVSVEDVSHSLKIAYSNFRDVHYAIKSRDVSADLTSMPSGDIYSSESKGTSVSPSYAKSRGWGESRAILDAISNHSDAKATRCDALFLVGNKWVGIDKAKLCDEDKIKKIMLCDDGNGYPIERILIFNHVENGDPEKTIGQFGEGLKMIGSLSLIHDWGLEYASRNWSAKADAISHKDGDGRPYEVLGYKVNYRQNGIIGSRTIFHSPSKELIREALELDKKVLFLDKDYEPVFHDKDYGDIVSTEEHGNIYVNGVYVTTIPCFFSYNFNNVKEISADRNSIPNFNYTERISKILSRVTDVEILRRLLSHAYTYSIDKDKIRLQYGFHNNYQRIYYEDPKELSAIYNMAEKGILMPSLWKEAFEKQFELSEPLTVGDEVFEPKKAILKSRYFSSPEQFNELLQKYNIINFENNTIQNILTSAGIETDESICEKHGCVLQIDTGLSTHYGEDSWGVAEMIRDAAQNHLPADSGGTNIFVRFQTTDGEWHSYSELKNFNNNQIIRLKISDDGSGYDLKRLGVIGGSSKRNDDSTGQFGEGLKMLSLVSIRHKCPVEFHSGTWYATTSTKDIKLDEGSEKENTEQLLTYKVTVKTKNELEDCYGDEFAMRYEKSSTIFSNPTDEIIEEFRSLGEKILSLQDARAQAKSRDSSVLLLDYNSHRVFVRDILVSGVDCTKYGYHFKNYVTKNRDRNNIPRADIKEQVKRFIESVAAPDSLPYDARDERVKNVISQFLHDAKDYAENGDEDEFVEFSTYFSPINPDAWINTFKEVFGDRTSIRRQSDQDMNAVHQAEHMGLKIVTLPDTVASSLTQLVGSKNETIPSYESELSAASSNKIDIPSEELTEYEQLVIDTLLNYYNSLLESPIKEIGVYYYPENYHGTKASGLGGFSDEKVLIERKTINGDLTYLGHVFFHETGHAKTRATDAAPEFRNYFTKSLSKIGLSILPESVKAKLGHPTVTEGGLNIRRVGTLEETKITSSSDDLPAKRNDDFPAKKDTDLPPPPPLPPLPNNKGQKK